jgi:hypothetical protein
MSNYNYENALLGQLYSADDQCKLIMGPLSNHTDCSVN